MSTAPSDRIMTHLRKLVDEIGARPAGSAAHHRAEAYVREVFEAAGLDIEEVTLPFPDWQLHASELWVDGEGFPIDVNPFSPPCDVTSEFVVVSTLPQLEAAELGGKIALLTGELSKGPIFPINFEAIQFERDQAINRLLIKKEPAAVLAVNLHPWRRVHIFEDEDFPIPSATISVEVGRHLLTHLSAGLTLKIESVTRPSHVTTLVGAHGLPEQPCVLFMGHYDTKIETPGAFDNGTGMALMMALAERLPQLDLPIRLKFFAFADEEYGAHTDFEYIRRHEVGFGEILFVVNMDGVGLITENTTITMLSQGEAFEAKVREMAAAESGVVWTDPWIQSNHASFAMRGVPCVTFSSLTWERAHQADDSVDWIDSAKLDETYRLVKEIVQALSGKEVGWFRG